MWVYEVAKNWKLTNKTALMLSLRSRKYRLHVTDCGPVMAKCSSGSVVFFTVWRLHIRIAPFSRYESDFCRQILAACLRAVLYARYPPIEYTYMRLDLDLELRIWRNYGSEKHHSLKRILSRTSRRTNTPQTWTWVQFTWPNPPFHLTQPIEKLQLTTRPKQPIHIYTFDFDINLMQHNS